MVSAPPLSDSGSVPGLLTGQRIMDGLQGALKLVRGGMPEAVSPGLESLFEELRRLQAGDGSTPPLPTSYRSEGELWLPVRAELLEVQLDAPDLLPRPRSGHDGGQVGNLPAEAQRTDWLPVRLTAQRVEQVPPAVWRRLAAYDWPGNVRELRNLVERCVLPADGPVFPERWLCLGDSAVGSETSAEIQSDGDRLCLPLDGSLSLDEMEQRILSNALARNGDNVSLTARVLGTTREKLRYRVQKYGLKTSD